MGNRFRQISLLLLATLTGLTGFSQSQFENRIKSIKKLANQNPDSAITLLEDWRTEFNSSPSSDKVQVTYLLAEINWTIGKYNRSLELNAEGLEDAKKLGNMKKTADFINQQGIIHSQKGESQKAIEKYLDALKRFEAQGDMASVARVCNNVGSEYGYMFDSEKATQYHKRSLEIKKELGDSAGMGKSYVNIGLEELNMQQFDAAIRSLHNGRMMLAPLRSSYFNCIIYSNLGLAFLEIDSLDSAENYLNLAVKMAEGNAYPRFMSHTFNSLANLDLLKKNYTKAIEDGEQALQISQQYGNKSEERFAAETLSKAYAAVGRFQEAFESHKLFIKIRDSIAGEETKTQIADLELKYDTEKKENQIVSLKLEQRENEQKQNLLFGGLIILMVVVAFGAFGYSQKQKANRNLAEKNAVIAQSLEDKEMLMREIHHRVKNNLEIISGLIELQADYIDEGELLDTVRNWQNRIDSIALVHKDLYKKDELTNVNVREYMQKLIQNIGDIYRSEKVRVNIDVDDFTMDIDNAIPVGLIVNEIVTNAYKYAFDQMQQGEINISMHSASAQDVELMIADNGKGIEAKVAESSESLGLKLVNLLTRQIGGSLDYGSKNGAWFKIVFPNSAAV